MLEFLLEIISSIGDFFAVYDRKRSDFAKGCLFDILMILCIVGAVLCWNWKVYILAGIFTVAGIFMLILGIRHSYLCIRKKQQNRENTAPEKNEEE